MPKYVVIIPAGRMGNNMIEYMYALYLKSEIPELEIYCDTPSFLNMFGIKLIETPKDNHKYKKIVVNNGNTNTNKILNEISKMGNIIIEISYNYFDANNIPRLLLRYKNIFGNKSNVCGYDNKYLVIHLRMEDIGVINNPSHKNYPIVPFSFYRFIIQQTKLQPVFIGQMDNKIIVSALKKQFSDAIFVNQRDVLTDFECIRKSKNILISVSTYAFLAAFLSECDTNVYMPMYGFFNNADRPDINYKINDSRFHYYYFPKIEWLCSMEQISNIISDNSINYQLIE